LIVFEIWNIEQGKWIEANFATIPLGMYTLRIRDRLTLELKNVTSRISEDTGKNEGNPPEKV